MEKVKPTDLTKRQILNNHIVLMRKCVRQARVHVINKLTKEVRRLQERKGEAKAVEKSKRKASKLLNEISITKHLKEDIVSISALQNKSSLDEVLQSTSATSEERCLARLTHHRAVQRQVELYREQNPLWELQIPVLLEKSTAKLKKKSKRLVQGNKDQSKTIKKVESHREKEDFEKSANANFLSKASEVNSLNTKDDISAKKYSSKGKKKGLASASLKLDKTEGTVKIKQLSEDLSELITELSTPFAEQDSQLKEEGETATGSDRRRPKSSFFIGGVEPPKLETEYTITRDFKPKARSRPSCEEERRPLFKKGKIVNKPKQTHNTPRYFDKGPPISRPAKSPEQKDIHEKLHPSWEAKKRIQSSIINTAFKGKKIKFEDDE